MPGITSYFDEGLATYLGGSGKMTYMDYLKKLRENLNGYDFLEVFRKDIFDRDLWTADMPITYVLAAVICDYGINKLGKDRFFDLLNERRDKHAIINELGIYEVGLDRTLKEFVGKKQGFSIPQ